MFLGGANVTMRRGVARVGDVDAGSAVIAIVAFGAPRSRSLSRPRSRFDNIARRVGESVAADAQAQATTVVAPLVGTDVLWTVVFARRA